MQLVFAYNVYNTLFVNQINIYTLTDAKLIVQKEHMHQQNKFFRLRSNNMYKL